MKHKGYSSMPSGVHRRDFLKITAGTGLVLGIPGIWGKADARTERIKTNIDDALKVKKTRFSLPGPFPGKVVEIHDPAAVEEDRTHGEVVNAMFERGVTGLTGKTMKQSFKMFFTKNDVVGIKVNPVGPGLISTHLELVDAVINWLTGQGIPRKNIIIWDRFDYMLADAGFTSERFPGVGIEGLQTMDETAAEAAARGESGDNSRWLDKNGHHVSEARFDENVYYWADVEGPAEDLAYLNQHVFNGKYSYFGRLLTRKLTKLINVPVFKNTGNGISMTTKNLGYGAICNTNRLHSPLFFDVCTEVLAFPVIRDKLVLNVTDGLVGQYDGGPDGNAQFRYVYNTLFFATDPFALDRLCQEILVAKRKEMGVKVNEHPRYTEYLRYAEQLGLGIGHLEKIEHIRIS